VFVSKSTKDMERAQAAFHKKEIQAREGATAMAEYPAAGRGANDTCDLIRRLLSGWERAPPFELRDHAPHFVQAWF